MFCFSKISQAATYYVSTAGFDTNSGTQAAPWKTIAKVNSSTFQPGDFILFKRGEMWREQLVPPSSGSPGNPITFGAYGSGNSPILSGAVIPQASQWTNAYGNVWIASDPVKPFQVLFNGVIGTQVTVLPANPLEWGWDATSSLLYIYSEYPGVNPAVAYTNPGVEVGYTMVVVYITDGKSYITIDGLTIERENAWAGIMIKNNNNHITIRNCVIRDGAFGGIQAGYYGAGNTISDLLIENNDVYNNNAYGVTAYKSVASLGNENIIRNNRIYSNGLDGLSLGGAYTIIENNVIHDNGIKDYPGISPSTLLGSSGIHENGDLPGDPQPLWGDNNIIRYNVIYNQVGYDSDAKGIILDINADNNQVYYNIAYHNNGSCITSFRSLGNNIYNNVCYDNVRNPNSWQYSNTGEIVIWDDAQYERTVNTNIKNNIVYATQSWALAVSIQGILTDNPGINYSNNLWYKEVSGNWYFDGSEGSSLTTWNTKSFVVGDRDRFGNPNFVNAPGADFHLQPTSPAINAGTNVGLTRDYAGTLVPQGPLPDIGAYEHVQAADTTPPAPPSGVTVQ